jgi:signal transduction histidine kinase
MTTSNKNQSKDMTFILSSLKTIAESVGQAVSAGTAEQVLQQIANVAREVVRVRYAALGIPDGKGGLKYFKTVGMTEEEIKKLAHYPHGLGLLGAIMHERETVRLEHIADDARSVGFPKYHPPMDRLLGVPIQTGQELFGMLYLCDRNDGLPFTEEDQWLVETFAGYAALAISGAQLSEQRSRITLFEERERVSMELHDGTIQSLYAVGMQLQLIRMNHPETENELKEVVHSIDTVIEDIRSYIMNLKIANYQQQSLYECFHDLVQRLHVADRMTVEIDAPNRPAPFPPPIFEAVCQIAQEALSNILRHAEAHHVQISTSQRDYIFRMTIKDDGKGFDSQSENYRNGLGLRNIQQRARIHGGDIFIHSAPGKGTRLMLQIPLKIV